MHAARRVLHMAPTAAQGPVPTIHGYKQSMHSTQSTQGVMSDYVANGR